MLSTSSLPQALYRPSQLRARETVSRSHRGRHRHMSLHAAGEQRAATVLRAAATAAPCKAASRRRQWAPQLCITRALLCHTHQAHLLLYYACSHKGAPALSEVTEQRQWANCEQDRDCSCSTTGRALGNEAVTKALFGCMSHLFKVQQGTWGFQAVLMSGPRYVSRPESCLCLLQGQCTIALIWEPHIFKITCWCSCS
jgi:hypothetical protein